MTDLSNTQVFSILQATLEALETAAGCRGRWKLRLTSTTQVTPGSLPDDYLDTLRKQYDKLPPAPLSTPGVPPLWWSAPAPLPFPGMPGVVYCRATPIGAADGCGTVAIG